MSLYLFFVNIKKMNLYYDKCVREYMRATTGRPYGRTNHNINQCRGDLWSSAANIVYINGEQVTTNADTGFQ